MNIEISRETEARLGEEARRIGVSVEVLLERLMDERRVTTCAVGAARSLSCRSGILETWDRSIGGTSTTMSVEPGIVDANVLVYSAHADAPQHAASRALIETARDSQATLYVTSQILCEFYSIVTNSRRVPHPRSPEEAWRAISGFLAFLHVLPIPARTVEVWLGLLLRHPVTGGDIFDLQIAASMQANGVQRIYTFNGGDFEVFPELAVVTP